MLEACLRCSLWGRGLARLSTHLSRERAAGPEDREV